MLKSILFILWFSVFRENEMCWNNMSPSVWKEIFINISDSPKMSMSAGDVFARLDRSASYRVNKPGYEIVPFL
jgi:hypothetical protein